MHPDGRVQRLRPAIGRPRAQPARVRLAAGVRAGWQVIADVAGRAGHELRALSGSDGQRPALRCRAVLRGPHARRDRRARRALARERGRPRAGAPASGATRRSASRRPRRRPTARLRLGTYRTLWGSKEVDASPALHFLRARQVVELSPEDADARGIREGDRVEVGVDGASVQGAVRLRAAIPGGTVFVALGTEEHPANVLTAGLVDVRRVGGPESDGASAVAAQVVPAAEGLAEAPASAPLDIPSGADG